MYSYGPPHMAEQKQDDQLEHTYSSYVRIQDVALKTCRKRWTIGRSGERGSGISVPAARHDDDDDCTHCQMHMKCLPKINTKAIMTKCVKISTGIYTNQMVSWWKTSSTRKNQRQWWRIKRDRISHYRPDLILIAKYM